MPKTDKLPDNEAREIEFEIKKQIAGAGSNVSDIVKRLNEEYGTSDTPQAITRQLKQGTIPLWKVFRIANVLGYEIQWIKKETSTN
ncbi:hypothetical protein [Pelosinus sp. UFO1]|uniref:hypothetical protein n=1 Tax=Pelosinus sp. UFO1 TaxID=484770 RepID=UPI0004D10BF5|nr:hypothetical protein [Pelosinus sp. UFO1]AIF52020.1 hypothetical protein UFO1_2473 [Pelosinus sp. UFO1]